MKIPEKKGQKLKTHSFCFYASGSNIFSDWYHFFRDPSEVSVMILNSFGRLDDNNNKQSKNNMSPNFAWDT